MTTCTDGAAGSLSAVVVEPNGNNLNVNVSYSGSGKYVLTSNATVAGNATVTVYYNSTLVVGQGAYLLDVIPAGPYAPYCFSFGYTSGVGSPGVAGTLGTFYVQLRDGFMNNITANVGNVVTATIIPNFDSSYSLTLQGVYDPVLDYYAVQYNVTLSGNFTVSVQVNSVNTGDGTRLLQVVPANVYAGTSVLYGVSETAIAGVQQYGWLQLKDVFGNNASNANVDVFIQATQGTEIVNGSVVTSTQGLCQITYHSKSANPFLMCTPFELSADTL
jgi:hypothetical protein